MGLSCGAAVIGWIVVFSGSVAVPFTAGASAFVVGIGVTAALASSAQCGFGYSSTEIRHATLTQLKDALGGLLGIAGSYRTGHVGTASTIAIGLYEDLTE
jgi:hypothetical protein